MRVQEKLCVGQVPSNKQARIKEEKFFPALSTDIA